MSERQYLVLHICCAPDEAYVVKTLAGSYDLFCFWSNPNISPEDEYHTRINEAQRVAEHFGVGFDAAPYEPALWEAAVEPYLDTKEGGARCGECFLLRLRQTAAFCARLGWPAFTTVMSISPHKRIQMLNEAGIQAGLEYGVEYVPFDFKKKDGFKKSIALSTELGLYRQDYCGCRLSLRERDQRNGMSR